MNSKIKEYINEIIWTIVIILSTITITRIIIEKKAYKQGQIDALSGKVKYKLVENKTSTWEYIKE